VTCGRTTEFAATDCRDNTSWADSRPIDNMAPPFRDAACQLRTTATLMDLPLRNVPSADRATVVVAVRSYVAARGAVGAALRALRGSAREDVQIARAAALGDTHHSAWARQFLEAEPRSVLAERIAGAAGLAVFLNDWLHSGSATSTRGLYAGAANYVGAVVDVATAAKCLHRPGTRELIRRALHEFAAAAELWVTARSEQLALVRRGVTRATVERNVCAARRSTISSAAVVSEVITLETDLVALA